MKPPASQVLSAVIRKKSLPSWTSFFIRYSDVNNDQFGKSHFNWKVNECNYQVLRTGCFPYLKYHCSKRPLSDLKTENRLINCLKLVNLGVPTLAYGIAAVFLIRHTEIVETSCGNRVKVYFLMKEDTI